MCSGSCKPIQNVDISCEICVNVFQLIQNVNISFEICANVFGSLMDPYNDFTWVRIWIVYGSPCGSYMGRLYVNVFTADLTF